MDNWVIIPCHNNSALLLEGLKSIMGQDVLVKIFAINNGSKDNVANVLNGLNNEHIVTTHSPQLGVGGAWNFSLQYIFGTMEATRVLVVNQDVVLRPDTYRTLIEQDRDFVTCVSTRDRTISPPDPHMPQIRPTRPHPDFSCFLIRKDAYGAIGRFDEAFYPAWFEDNDYHIRAARKGIELVCIDLPFYHYAAATMKTATDYDAAHYYGPAFLKSKERFQSKWGCLPGTKLYEEMCNPANWTAGMYTGPTASTDNLP
jgi:GT2 family glycosyltransferase